MANGSKKSLRGGEYTSYYDGFRGVDFSTDHTRISAARFAYLVNMWRDYHADQGGAVSTVPGFRRVWKTAEQKEGEPESDRIWGLHKFSHRNDDGVLTDHILVHSGKRIYEWEDLNRSTNIVESVTVVLPEAGSVTDDGQKRFVVDLGDITEIIAVYDSNGNILIPDSSALPFLIIHSRTLNKDDIIRIEYYDTVQARNRELFSHTYNGENAVLDSYTIELDLVTAKKVHLITECYIEGQMFTNPLEWSFESPNLTIRSKWGLIRLNKADKIHVVYSTGLSSLMEDAAERSSVTFTWDNALYYLDGEHYRRFDGIKFENVVNMAYIPTTFSGIIPSGENANTGIEMEQRNYLSEYVNETFVADGTTVEFPLVEDALGITRVEVYGERVSAYEYELYETKNVKYLKFKTAPKKPEDANMPHGYAGVKVILRLNPIHEDILGCTLAAVYDDRVFLSGNPKLPNHVFWSALNDPTYFGVLNFVQDGVGNTPVTALLPVADQLMVLKGDTVQDGSVYYHTGSSTGIDLQPRIYPSQKGLSGIGCLGPCTNFFDDPVFLSRLGLEAVGQLSVRYERAIEHRSSLVDAKLTACDLTKSAIAEWDGYLLILCDGKIFMADSRQRFTHENGTVQYEWYYLEDIGIYDGQYTEYRYAQVLPESLSDITVDFCPECGTDSPNCAGNHAHISLKLNVANSVFDADRYERRDMCGETANAPDDNGDPVRTVFFKFEEGSGVPIAYVVLSDPESESGYSAYLCETYENKIGGVFHPAVMLETVDESLFFGTDNGVICRFNTDKRTENGNIPAEYYNFDGRSILSGVATKMDNCGVPHLTKSTIKRSLVIKTRSLQESTVKVKVRTNREQYNQIAHLNSSIFGFNSVDFSDWSFVLRDDHIFGINEKEKKWVEKQFYLFSDEYCKPFSLYYIAYRYKIAGRYKE